MDIICYSHLRWNFVYQRPQHLLSRLAKAFRIFYVEEPIFDSETGYLEHYQNDDLVRVVVPHLPSAMSATDTVILQNHLLKVFFEEFQCTRFIAWYYTPMALSLNISIEPDLIIYDCMDELSAFKNAPAELKKREAKLLSIADIVFTGGYSLYEAKKHTHKNIHLFASSIDRGHFEKALIEQADPADQESIPHPRIGFFGVVDERMNISLLTEMADEKPEWHFIIIGPVVKIDPNTLPRKKNIHFLGQKDYKKLPSYISHWDVAMMPFAINESTRFISPTKTPEYLAAGKPVVSTPINDVIRGYGDSGLVFIAGTTEKFIQAIQDSMELARNNKWLLAVNEMLSQNSWEKTVDRMMYHINIALEKLRTKKNNQKGEMYV